MKEIKENDDLKIIIFVSVKGLIAIVMLIH